MLEKIKTGLDNAKEFKKDIDYVNHMLGVVDCDNPTVELVHETPLMQQYVIKYMEKNGAKYKDIIEFNGSIVKFACYLEKETILGDVIYRFLREFDLDKTGYMGWKLGVLQKALDNRIKQQEKVKMRAEKAKNTSNLQTKIRYALFNKILDRNIGL
ncbi:MAG: hypothetical protein J6W41_02415 [Alphaproteobacteria bacterium]|nr:hypothetical protein [Alphaproteobacteria bacterium]